MSDGADRLALGVLTCFAQSAASVALRERGRWYTQMLSCESTVRPPTSPMIQLFGSGFGHAGSRTKLGACALFDACGHSSARRSSALAFFSASAALLCACSRPIDVDPPAITLSNAATTTRYLTIGPTVASPLSNPVIAVARE